MVGCTAAQQADQFAGFQFNNIAVNTATLSGISTPRMSCP